MELTLEQLKQLLPKNPYVSHWHHALSILLPDYEINTAQRIAAFIAQCSHESGGFTALKENLNYKAETLSRIWPKYFPPEIAKAYVAMPNKQEAIANRAYANRMGNGDEHSGDGWKFNFRFDSSWTPTQARRHSNTRELQYFCQRSSTSIQKIRHSRRQIR